MVSEFVITVNFGRHNKEPGFDPVSLIDSYARTGGQGDIGLNSLQAKTDLKCMLRMVNFFVHQEVSYRIECVEQFYGLYGIPFHRMRLRTDDDTAIAFFRLQD